MAQHIQGKITKLLIRGAENLEFYKKPKNLERRVMTLPLIRLIGHEVAKCDWSSHSKIVLWAAMCVGFFGSFRFGEILAKHKTSITLMKPCCGGISFFGRQFCQNPKRDSKVEKKRRESSELVRIWFFQLLPSESVKKTEKSLEQFRKWPCVQIRKQLYPYKQKNEWIHSKFFGSAFGRRC